MLGILTCVGGKKRLDLDPGIWLRGCNFKSLYKMILARKWYICVAVVSTYVIIDVKAQHLKCYTNITLLLLNTEVNK